MFPLTNSRLFVFYLQYFINPHLLLTPIHIRRMRGTNINAFRSTDP
jgi:hypothetical protein